MIIMSYRQQDDSIAEDLREQLSIAFGNHMVHAGVRGLVKPGDDFVDAIEDAVKDADVLLVLIGENWMGDWVNNTEDPDVVAIQTALDAKKRVIPMLLKGGDMPSSSDLPETLKSFARRSAFLMRADTFNQDVDALVDSLKQMVTPRAKPQSPKSAEPPAAQPYTPPAQAQPYNPPPQAQPYTPPPMAEHNIALSQSAAQQGMRADSAYAHQAFTAPPGYAQQPPPGYAQQPPPGYAQQPPPGYGAPRGYGPTPIPPPSSVRYETSFIAALTYPTKDKEFLAKILIGGLILIIPLIGALVLLGYTVRYGRYILADKPGLPMFDDFGGDLGRGFSAGIGLLLLNIILMIPYGIITFLVTSSLLEEVYYDTYYGGYYSTEFSATGALLFLGISLIYAWVAFAANISAFSSYIASDRFGSMLDIGRHLGASMKIGQGISLFFSLLVYGFIGGILIGFGYAFLIIPGLMATAWVNIGAAMFSARWAMDNGYPLEVPPDKMPPMYAPPPYGRPY